MPPGQRATNEEGLVEPNRSTSLTRRSIALASCAAVLMIGAAAPPPPQAATFDLSEATIVDLQRRMDSGQDTARSLAEKYLARIDAIDRAGPALRSVIEINPDALTIADRLDVERTARGARGPLHGIPV